MLTLSLNVDGVQRKIKTLAKTARDVEPALKIFDRYYRARVDQRFASQGPGWPARAESTEANQQRRERQARALAAHQLKRKLKKEYRRALKRLQRGKGTATAIGRRYLVLKEFERQMAGGILGQQTGADRRLEKSVAGLRERKGRAEAKASQRLLGKMPSSMFSKIANGTLVVGSKFKFAGVQNEGATVGHGAKVPARPFNYLEPIDVDVLAEILANRLQLAAES
jgi:phage gpG-like protein